MWLSCEHLCLVLELREKAFSFSLLSMILGIGLLCLIFIMLRYVPSVPTLLRVITINGFWSLSDAFPAIAEMIIWFLSCFINVVYHVDCFVNVEPSLHLKNKFHLECMLPLLLNLVHYYFVEIFTLCSLQISAWFFVCFCFDVCVFGLGIRVILS